MALVTGNHSVLVFKHMQFIGQWTRWSGTNAIGYTPTGARNQLIVVVEAPTGTLTTYYFLVPRDQDVWVVEDVVHIPALCQKKSPGDTTRCRD